jgi:hypothetical protein
MSLLAIEKLCRRAVAPGVHGGGNSRSDHRQLSQRRHSSRSARNNRSSFRIRLARPVITALRPYDNIPIFSYLILRGRCRFCRKPISIRYPIVEALTAFLFVAVALHDGTSFALPFDLAFVAALLALIFIDAKHMIPAECDYLSGNYLRRIDAACPSPSAGAGCVR